MSAMDKGAAVRAQFSNFRLSPDKTEVIYEGRTADLVDSLRRNRLRLAA